MPELKWLRREVEHWHSRLEVSNQMDRRIAQVMYQWRKKQYKERGNNWSRKKNRLFMQQQTDLNERQIAEHKAKWKQYCAKQDTTHS
jgi:hypothetical protein